MALSLAQSPLPLVSWLCLDKSERQLLLPDLLRLKSTQIPRKQTRQTSPSAPVFSRHQR